MSGEGGPGKGPANNTRPEDCSTISTPCPRCGKLGHASPLDDPLPPMPAIEVDGDIFLELGLVEQAIRAVRAQADPVARMMLALLHDAGRAT